jgi:hypothetical protein
MMMMSEDQVPQARPSNVLGIVGFVLAFCLSPIGVLVSLAALAKSPRGFAIAGIVVGLLGTVAWVILGLFLWATVPAAMQATEVVTDTVQIRAAIARYRSNNDGALPADLASLNLSPGVDVDPWGTPYRYELSDEHEWVLTVAGPDTTFDDESDVVITPTTRENEIGQMIGRTFGEDIMRDRFSNP